MGQTRHAVRSLRGFVFVAVGVVVLLFGIPASFGQDGTPPSEPPKKVDDLGERLIRKAVTDGEEDIMATIVRLMTEASRKMEIEFDPGEETQALQGRIQEKLEEAIKAAASKQRARKQSPAPTDPDKRRMPTTGKREQRPEAKAKGESSPGSTSNTAEAPAADGRSETERAALQETRRSWGHLPSREREEVIQGVGEGFLERYRVWIERYYRALQESDE
ncbi:MAG: hypothetical protein AAB363_02670 [Planctomycetota bacterium]